jgi:heat shock protein HtpX
MYEQIASNKRKSLFLILFFLVLIFALAWAFGQITEFGSYALIPAVVIALIMTWGSYYYSDKIVLAVSRARPVEKEEYPYLYNVVEGLAIAAGLPKPRCYVINDTAPNAFASGRNPEKAVIVVTEGLLEKLNRAELEGVIAHEMSHIKNYDIRLQTLAVVMVGVVVLLSDWIMRSFLWGGKGRRRDSKGGGNAGTILILVALVLAILSPLIAQLLKLAVSRKREFLADADGAMLTRYPPGLASALKKLAADKEPLEVANKATAHLYIVNPLKEGKRGGGMAKLFSTHPPIEERVRALERM